MQSLVEIFEIGTQKFDTEKKIEYRVKRVYMPQRTPQKKPIRAQKECKVERENITCE